jgi:hypothetical protein
LDPFAGSGTTGKVAKRMCLDFILIELNENYLDKEWMRQSVLNFFEWDQKAKPAGSTTGEI